MIAIVARGILKLTTVLLFPVLDGSIECMQLSISQPKPAVNKPKLLVVDDEPDNLDLLYRTFYREFKVLRAENGYEALELLATQPDVAVIVSDQRMPGMSGTEFLSQTAAKYPNIIRIILTGYTDVDDLVDAINEGKVFKYVQKPWEDDHLRRVVRRALETHVVLKTVRKNCSEFCVKKAC